MSAYLRILFLLISFSGLLHPLQAEPRNAVVFLVDDLGWTDLGCFGSTFYETPNLDRLAASGARLTNAYAACPVCSPTRAAMMTGLYPQRTGITDYIGAPQPDKWKRSTKLLPAPYQEELDLEAITLAEVFKQKEYATFFAGKWHLGKEGFWPEDQGFDFNLGGIDRGGPYGGKKYFSPYGNPRLPDGPEGEHLPDRLASETVKFIEQHRQEPFVAYLSFYSVHTPLIAREDLLQKYEAKAKSLPETEKPWLKIGEREWRAVQNHAVYAAMVEAMDQAVGKVLNGLKLMKLEEDTIVIFTSDNGGLSTSEGHPTTNLPLRAGKGWMYEGGIRVPAIVRWPGVTRPNSTIDTPVISMDYLPTMLDASGLNAQAPKNLDGKSLRSILSGEKSDDRPLFWHYPHYGNQGGSPSAAVRLGDWKLIEWYEDGRQELFNLAKDVGEENNLLEKYPDQAKQLAELLSNWRDEVGAIFPTPR